MTNENALEGNKLIAEFMGRYWYDKPSRRPQASAPEAEPPINILIAKYHYSYDWLIPVVVRCQELLNTSEGDDEWKNELKWKYTRVSDKLAMVTIMPLYEAVIEFIKWYNNK